jgi:hypothetical protein
LNHAGVIIDDGDDEAEAKEKALAEHVARHPEDVGRTVEDFNWVLNVIVRPVHLGSGMPIMKGWPLTDQPSGKPRRNGRACGRLGGGKLGFCLYFRCHSFRSHSNASARTLSW